MNELNVHEIFASLQGEGPFTGIPAVFLRLSGCVAPYCKWCDTPESLTQGARQTTDSIYKEISTHKIPLIVITGGEPFLQWENGLKDLHNQLLQSGFRIQYETSGKVKIPNLNNPYSIDRHDHVTVVCSPKQKEGGCFKNNEWTFIEENHSRVDFYKFVYHENEEIIRNFIDKNDIPPNCVLLMPEGTSRQIQLERMETVWDTCLKNGWRFSPRLHTITFDGKKGV